MRACLCWMSALALASTALCAAPRPAEPESSPDAVYRFPLITAPKLEKPPTIDGTVDKAEWAGAAQSAPLVQWRGEQNGLLGELFHCYWVGYTDDTLYLAWRFDRPPFALTPKADAAPDPDNTAVWGDDKIELMLRPNVGEGAQGYNFVINAKGVAADRFNNRIEWNGDWKRAARVTDRGWEGELSIPFKSLDRATPKPGEMWDILLLSNPRTPNNQIVVNSYLHEWPGWAEYGYLRFGDATTPAVRVLDAGPIDAHEAGMTLEIAGGASPASVKVEAALLAGKEGSKGIQAEVSIEDAGGTIVPRNVDLNFFDAVEQITAAKTLGVLSAAAKVEQTAAVEPGKPLRFPVRAAVPYGSHVLVYRVTDATSGKLIAGGATPFVQKPLFELSADNYLLVAKGLKVTASYQRMSEVTDKCHVVAELLEGDKVVSKFDLPATPAQGRTVQILPTPKRFDTSYTLRVAILGPDGAKLVEQTRDVKLPAQPVWLDNTIGTTDDPLPGWKPIELTGNDEAKVVLRDYKLGAAGFPDAITSRDKPLLTAPISLTVADKPPQWSARKLESRGPGKIVWTSSAAEGDLKLSMRTTLEYDGLLIYDLTLAPAGEKADIKGLSLRIPYRKDLARLRRATGEKGFDFVIDEKTGKPKALKEFMPVMTVGDFDTGLSWYCEWDRHWQIGGGSKLPVASMEEADGQTLDWRINMIGEAGKTITEPVTITFALQAMPVRELDTSYNYDQRHLYSGAPIYVPKTMPIGDLTDCDLRYELAGNTSPEHGSAGARMAMYISARTFAIGNGDDAICAGWSRAWWEQYRSTYFLYEGADRPVWAGKQWTDARQAKFEAKIYDAPREDGWTEVGISWQRQGDQVLITHCVYDAVGKVHSSSFSWPWEKWSKAYSAGELVIGGGRTVAVDQVVMSDQVIPPQALLEAVRTPASELSKPYTVIDPVDRIRFYRGKFVTQPTSIAGGKGGVAGSRYWGALVQLVEGRPDPNELRDNKPITNHAVLLPSKQDDDVWSIGRWLGIKYVFPDFEQFHNMLGYYGQNHVHNPAAVKIYYQPVVEHGMRSMLYVTFGMHPQYDKYVSPFMQELSLKPKGLVYTAEYPSLGTPARDYIVWQLKQSVDQYKIRSFHLDGTLGSSRAPDHDPLTGNGWVDEQGNVHGRYALFGERDLAKRMRWLLHVYAPKETGDAEGLILLGHGSRHCAMTAGFVDITMSGEGGLFYATGWEKLQQPEDYPDLVAYRMGVPHQTLTKGQSEHKFSPNFTFMYMLMVNGSLRHSAYLNQPAAWHIAPDATAPNIYAMSGPYNPYFAKSSVGEQSNVTTLWWMLLDDMRLKEATFVPFFKVNEFVTFGPDTLRGALHYRRGESALVIAANFTGEDAPQAQVKIDLAKLGLAGKNLACFDAFTDDTYALAGDTVTLAVPSKNYRLIRIEPR